MSAGTSPRGRTARCDDAVRRKNSARRRLADGRSQERLVIMGQSGSGKSTILRLILGILEPNAGSVFFKQFEITRLRRRKLQQMRRHIGMVYQYSALAQFAQLCAIMSPCLWKN